MSVERDNAAPAPTALQAYLLGQVDFDAALLFQRRLHYEVTGDRSTAALVLCEHAPLITVGRQGSRAQILAEPAELEIRRWPVRWVNRGGGCWLHVPGQLNLYAVVPLDTLNLSVARYLSLLGSVAQRVLADFDVRSELRDGGVWVKSRMVAALGVAIRDWVSYFGMCFNCHPDLEHFRCVRSSSATGEPMSSLERERRGRVRPALVRERFVEHFQATFGFERLALFSDHPALQGKKERLRPTEAVHYT